MTPELKKLYITRLRHANIISTLLAGLPFVRSVILNGSLAQGKIKPSSDIDLLIIAQKGRIFTARAFCLFLAWVSGQKRSSDEKRPHGGRFCLNYFLTSDFLIIPHNRSYQMNQYCAENYSKSVLLAGDEELFDEFMSVNQVWMKKYLATKKFHVSTRGDMAVNTVSIVFAPCLPAGRRRNRRSNLKQFNNLTIKQLCENLLSGKCGSRMENWLKKMQLNRINRNPRTAKYRDLIVANDREMRFHPPKEKIWNQE